MQRIDLSRIDDEYTREALELLYDELLFKQPLLRGLWEFREFEVEGAATHTIKHNLNFIPTDVLLISYKGSSPSFNFSDFTREKISITTAGDSTFRCFLGKYEDY